MFIYLFVAAFIVRLIGLNQSLWLDESTTARVAQQYNYWQIITQFSPHDFHPPFYYLFMKFWTSLFGYSEIVLRMPSVVFSLLTGWLIYRIKLTKATKADALWTAGFFLFNPLIVYYSQEARMYSLVTLFITLVIYFYLRMVENKFKTQDVVLANVFSLLAIVTFYGAVFIFASLYLYLVFKKKHKTFLFLLPGAFLAAVVLYPLFLVQLNNSGDVLRTIPNWSTTLGKANLKNLALIPMKFTSGRISFEPKILYYGTAIAWASFVMYLSIKNLFKKKLLVLNVLHLGPILLGFLVSFYKPLLQYFTSLNDTSLLR